jgi:hypothetical protein
VQNRALRESLVFPLPPLMQMTKSEEMNRYGMFRVNFTNLNHIHGENDDVAFKLLSMSDLALVERPTDENGVYHY